MDLTASEEDIILDLLVNGDNTPKYIHSNTGISQNYVSDLLRGLEGEQLVRQKNENGVWTLTIVGVAVARELANQRDIDLK